MKNEDLEASISILMREALRFIKPDIDNHVACTDKLLPLTIEVKVTVGGQEFVHKSGIT